MKHQLFTVIVLLLLELRAVSNLFDVLADDIQMSGVEV